MSETQNFEPLADIVYTGVLEPQDLAMLTIGEAWVRTGEDKNAMLAALKFAASQSADAGIRRIASLGPTVDYYHDIETVMWQHPGETFYTVLPRLNFGSSLQPVPASTITAFNAVRRRTDKTSLCHAPSTSLYFGRDGLVSACCYSRANPYGRYPDQTLDEIWFGEWRGQMCSQIQRNILPYGCDKCADQLRAGNYHNLLATNFDELVPPPTRNPLANLLAPLQALRQPRRPAYPACMEFELSNKCNLECAMCSGQFSSLIRANREKLPPLADVYDAAFVTQLRAFIPHLKQAKFLGGEPFLIDIYFEIWDLLIELNPACKVNITTNGTAFSPKVQRALEHLNVNLVLSLDSLTPSIYAGIRVNGTLERTLINFEKMRQLTDRPGKSLTIAICPMTSNWHELPALVDFANERNLPIFFNTVTYPKTSSLKYLPPDQQQDVLTVLRAAIRPGANALEDKNFAALSGVCQQLAMWRGDQLAAPV